MPDFSRENCLFCKIGRGEIPSKQAYADDRFFAFHDINPQAPTHVLIIPRRHIATLDQLVTEDAEMIGDMLVLAAKLARELQIAQAGYRAVFNCNEGAGQSVWHIHLHLLGGRRLGWPPG